MDDIPENVRQELEFVFVQDVREAIAMALQSAISNGRKKGRKRRSMY